MKLPLIFTLPLIVASCSDLTPETEEAPAPPPTPPTKKVVVAPAPSVPTIVPTPDPTANPAVAAVSFMDPVTTGELLTEKNKKTVTGPVAPPDPSPKNEDDSVIDIDLPKPPKFTEAVKE